MRQDEAFVFLSLAYFTNIMTFLLSPFSYGCHDFTFLYKLRNICGDYALASYFSILLWMDIQAGATPT